MTQTVKEVALRGSSDSPHPTGLDLADNKKEVAIVAMGGSKTDFINGCMSAKGKPHKEVWMCNYMAGVINPAFYDMIWAMDHFMPKEDGDDAHEFPEFYKKLLVESGKPIMTSVAPDKMKNTVPYPMEDVVRFVGGAYFPRVTTVYAFVYAIMQGYERIFLYGTDFTFPAGCMPPDFYKLAEDSNMEFAVKGAACLNFWVGLALGRGIQVVMPGGNDLLKPGPFDSTRMYYGYPRDFKQIIPSKDKEEKENV